MLKNSRKKLLLLLIPVLAAGALSARGVILAQNQPQLTSAYTAGALPTTDPAAAAWDSAPAVDVPLTPQAGVFPALLQATIPSMKVRSLNDGQWISFLLEWSDPTKDISATKPDEFRDAAALQFPLDTTIPGVCMGVPGKPVNLWHWKADWQEDIDTGFKEIVNAYPNFFKDYYPFAVGTPPFKVPQDFNTADARRFLVGWAVGNPLSEPVRLTPVEDLTAQGFGSAAHKAAQNVLGKGTYANGKWRVVFSRPLATDDTLGIQFKPGGKAFAAVAAWNGANQEVGARKQLSADFTVSIAAPPTVAGAAPGGGGMPAWAVAASVFGGLGAVAVLFGGFALGYSRSRTQSGGGE